MAEVGGVRAGRDAFDPPTLQLLASVMTAIDDGFCVADASGVPVLANLAARRMLGLDEPGGARLDDGAFELDEVTPLARHDHPLRRALRGESTASTVFLRNDAAPQGVVVSVHAAPLRAAEGAVSGAMLVLRDVTAAFREMAERRMLEQELQARADELALVEVDRRSLVARLRQAVDALSTPLLEISEQVLALPIVGELDERRASLTTERLLEEVVRRRCRGVIIDITGVEAIDLAAAQHLLQMIRAVELLGAQCVVSGVGPAVAQALVDTGVELKRLRTSRVLRTALQDMTRLLGAAKGRV